MNILVKLLASASVIGLLTISSCSKKADPDTSLIRDSGSNSPSPGSDAFNNGPGDDLSLAGDPLLGSVGNDLLAPRSDSLDAFNDPLKTIRPFEPVFFGFDQYNVNASERQKLSEIAEFLQSNPKAKLLIEGYCDWKGTPDYNKSLGDRRAATVKAYLIELGCEGNRIEVISLGDELATPNADSEQAQLDRRATFAVSKGLN